MGVQGRLQRRVFRALLSKYATAAAEPRPPPPPRPPRDIMKRIALAIISARAWTTGRSRGWITFHSSSLVTSSWSRKAAVICGCICCGVMFAQLLVRPWPVLVLGNCPAAARDQSQQREGEDKAHYFHK